MTDLRSSGLDERWIELAVERKHSPDQLARVCEEHGTEWLVATEQGPARAVLAGRLRDDAMAAAPERPAVGDWVILRARVPTESLRLIEEVLPRRTEIARRAVGRATRSQVVAANVDTVFVVSGLGRDVNERRLERFVAIIVEGGAVPVIVLTKSDLVADAASYMARVARVAPHVETHAVSAKTGEGLLALAPHLTKGRTLALVGTSGAGKTTLVNAWLGQDALRTGDVGVAHKGRHTTTHRQLILLPSGAAVIDTPGLREVGLWTADEGLEHTFDDVMAIAPGCRFSDCGHETEPDCAVRAAVEAGGLASDRVEAWRRLRREQDHVTRQADRGAAQRQKAQAKQLARAARKRIRDKERSE